MECFLGQIVEVDIHMRDTILIMNPRKIYCKSKNIKISENFYKSISIPIRLCQILGEGSFLYSRSGMKKSIIGYTAFVLQLIFYIGIVAFIAMNDHGNGDRENHGTHSTIVAQVSICCILIIWILGVFTVGKWSKLLKDIVAIDHGLAKFDVWVDYSKCLKKINWMLIAMAIQFAPFFFYLLYYRSNYLRLLFVIYLPNWNIIVLSYTVSIIVYLIQERLQLINSMLKKLTQNQVDISLVGDKKQEKPLKILCHVCSWHHDIIKLMALTSEVFGLKMVAFFGYAFIVIVMQVFMVSQLFKREINWMSLIEYVFAVGNYSFNVYNVCNVCEYTVREAKRSGMLIHQIETEDFDMRDEIEMFSLQIANENIEFSAAGFFPIDYSLLFSIIGGVTTYIIILIQLDSTDPEGGGSNSTDISEITSLATVSYGVSVN